MNWLNPTYHTRRTSAITAILLTVVLAFIALPAAGQESADSTAAPYEAAITAMPDSLPALDTDAPRHIRKNYWRPLAEVAGLNLGIWAFNHFAANKDYAEISGRSIRHNLKAGFRWDNDNLTTNCFYHPYNGSLYYNAARANGFSYWGSALFAIGGSAMWELFMEAELPSTNDIIATPIGGVAVGEPLYRAADAVTDDTSTGWERAGREIAGFILSPARGFNRIVTGQAWRRSATRGREFGAPPFTFYAGIGGKMLLMPYGGKTHTAAGGTILLSGTYGDLFSEADEKPFDYFTFSTELQAISGQPVLTALNIRGRIWNLPLLSKPTQKLNLGIYQDYDFLEADTVESMGHAPFRLSAPAAFGAHLSWRHEQPSRLRLDITAGADGVILGGIISDYYASEARNYNFGSGFALKGEATLTLGRERFRLSLGHSFYRLFSWKGYDRGVNPSEHVYQELNAQGDKSVASFGITDLRAYLRVWRHLYATFILSNYYRVTNYRDFPTVSTSSTALRLMLTYHL